MVGEENVSDADEDGDDDDNSDDDDHDDDDISYRGLGSEDDEDCYY